MKKLLFLATVQFLTSTKELHAQFNSTQNSPVMMGASPYASFSSQAQQRFNMVSQSPADISYMSNNWDMGDGIGFIQGANMAAPLVWMYSGGPGGQINAFTVAMKEYTAGGGEPVLGDNLYPLFQVRSDGDVGIGTTRPGARLHVVGRGGSNIDFSTTGQIEIKGTGPGMWLRADDGSNHAFIGNVGSGIANHAVGIWTPVKGWSTFNAMNDGSIGIGTAAPRNMLDIWGGVLSVTGADQNGTAEITSLGGTAYFSNNRIGNGLGIAPSGNVLIGNVTGTGKDSYLLNVAGDVRANKLTVNTTGADFVFEQNYKLMPLPEVENFIRQNRHLPGIAPAVDMQKNGIEIGEQQARLLQKLEEVTLYMIELKKENAALSRRLEKLEPIDKIQPQP